MHVKFSIIIPNFNSPFISRAIKSVIEQTYQNWEIIIVDNNSNNFPQKTIQKFNDKRIYFYKINNNNIIAKSRNFGIKKANNEWIAFLDSDDTWEKNKLEVTKNIITKNDTDLIFHGMYYLPKKFGCLKKIILDKSNPIKEPIFSTLIKDGNKIANSSVVVKKSKLTKINFLSERKEKFSWEDYDCWLRLALDNNKFYFINEILGNCWVGIGRVSNYYQSYINCKNFMKIYKSQIHEVLKNNTKRPQWVLKTYSNFFFKKKNYLRSYYFMKNSLDINFRSLIKYSFLVLNVFIIKNFFSLLKKIKVNIRKIFNSINIFKFEEKNFKKNEDYNVKNFQFIIINNHNELKKYENFFEIFHNKFLFQRFNKNDLLVLLVDIDSNKIACYGWITKKSPHFIEEINKKLFFDNGYVLYDFKTINNYKNKKLYKLLLNKITLNFDYPLFIYSLNSNNFSKKAILANNFKILKKLNIFSNDFNQKNFK